MNSTDLRTRWPTMKPRERDALVAERVFEHEVGLWADGTPAIAGNPQKQGGRGALLGVGISPSGKNTTAYAVPAYTTDPAHLLTLLGTIRYQWSVQYDLAGWGTFTVHADPPNEDDDGFVDHSARFETVSELPAAVALAALLSRMTISLG